MPEDNDHHRVADLLNSIFDLNLGWDNVPSETEISRSNLEELASLTSQLIDDVDLIKLWRCVLLLDSLSVRRLYEEISPGHVQLISPLTEADRYIREYLQDAGVAGRSVSRPSMPKGSLPHGLAAEETARLIDSIFNKFLEDEARVLKQVGLNQSSVRIIIHSLSVRSNAIKRNIIHPPTIRPERLTRLGGQLKDIYSVEGKTRRGRTPLSYASPKNIASTKMKLIAFATLWGDALPLMITKDWGITSVLSTVAGATVGGIFPDR